MDVFEEVDSEVAFRRRNEEEETEEGAREGPGKEALSTGETPEEGRVREAEDAAVRRALCAAMRADASGAMRRQSDLLTNLLMDNGFDSWVGLEHLEVADVTALGATLGVAKSVVRVVAQVCGKVTRPVGDETDHQSQATAMSEAFSQGGHR